MNKYIIQLFVFLILWFFVVCICFLLNRILDLNWFVDTKYYIVVGFAGAFAAFFEPKLSARIRKLLHTRS